MKGKFKIVRIYAPSLGLATKVIKTGLTEAQAHCQRADTRKEGVYFDGYTEQTTSKVYQTIYGGE